MPEFPGGDAALMQYLGSHIYYPKSARKNGVEGEVHVSFVVWNDGSIRDIMITKSVHPSLDKEVIRIVNSMPRWIPGMQDGKAVMVQYNLPVRFRLPRK